MSSYGTVKSCRLYTKNTWQQAFVLFEEEDSVNKFYDNWGIIYLKHFLKVHPLILLNDEWNRRSRFTLKLTGLPSGTTIVDLLDVFDATNAKTIVIPKGIRAYQPRPYAYVSFASEEDLNKALSTSFSLVNSDLTWCTLKHKCCQICGSPSHDAKGCPKNKDKSNKKYATIYNRYKPANYKKLLPKQKAQLNKSSPAAKASAAAVKQGTSYAAAASGQKDDLNASIHNPSNQHNQPKLNVKGKTAFETAVLEGLSALNNKFDSLNRRMTAIEKKFQEMEELIEHLYERDDHVYNDEDHNSLFADNNQPMFTEPMDSSDSSAIPQDPYGLTTTTSTHDNKRSRDQAEFSSPEESPAYKKLLEKYQRECELGKVTRDLYHDIRKQYVELQNTVDDIQQDHTDGSL